MEQQIKEQFTRAFYDTIKHSIQEQNFDHIVRLYAEIRDRLAKFIKKNAPTHQRLMAEFDVDLFEQMLRNNAFDGHSLVSLITNTFKWIHDLQMPIRDSETEEAKQRVMQAGSTIIDVVPVYIKEAHGMINILEKDMQEFYENRSHPVVQEMLRRSLQRK